MPDGCVLLDATLMDESFSIVGALPLAERQATAMDEQEFRALHDATARPILAYLLGVTGRRDLAEDVLQETYCRFLVREPPAMDANETRRYLFRIATNLLRDRWRRGMMNLGRILLRMGLSSMLIRRWMCGRRCGR
jgi:RNA polymerase sigma-70 factor (ECF subfamily)